MAGAGAWELDNLLKKEAGAVTRLASTGDTEEGVLTKQGSGSGRARADKARSIGGSDIEAKGVVQLKSGVAEETGRTYG